MTKCSITFVKYLTSYYLPIDSFLCTIDFSYIFIEDGNVFHVPTTFFFLFFCSHVLRLCFLFECL